MYEQLSISHRSHPALILILIGEGEVKVRVTIGLNIWKVLTMTELVPGKTH